MARGIARARGSNLQAGRWSGRGRRGAPPHARTGSAPAACLCPPCTCAGTPARSSRDLLSRSPRYQAGRAAYSVAVHRPPTALHRLPQAQDCTPAPRTLPSIRRSRLGVGQTPAVGCVEYPHHSRLQNHLWTVEGPWDRPLLGQAEGRSAPLPCSAGYAQAGTKRAGGTRRGLSTKRRGVSSSDGIDQLPPGQGDPLVGTQKPFEGHPGWPPEGGRVGGPWWTCPQ